MCTSLHQSNVPVAMPSASAAALTSAANGMTIQSGETRSEMSSWMMLVLGLLIGAGVMHMMIVRPMTASLEQVADRMVLMESQMHNLTASAESTHHANSLLDELSRQEALLVHAEAGLHSIGRFRREVISEANRLPVANLAIARLRESREQLIREAATLPEVTPVLVQVADLQRVGTSLDEVLPALDDSLDDAVAGIGRMTDDMQKVNHAVETAVLAIDPLVAIRDELQSTEPKTTFALDRLAGLVQIEQRLASSDRLMKSAAEHLTSLQESALAMKTAAVMNSVSERLSASRFGDNPVKTNSSSIVRNRLRSSLQTIADLIIIERSAAGKSRTTKTVSAKPVAFTRPVNPDEQVRSDVSHHRREPVHAGRPIRE